MVNGIVFDFNGTLFFDTDKHEEAWRIVFRDKLGREFEENEYPEHIHGRTNNGVAEYTLRYGLSLDEGVALGFEKERVYRDLCRSDAANLHFVTGAEALFDELKARGMPFMIATASEINNVKFFIEIFRLERWFDTSKIIYDDGTFPGKPAPDTYLRAAASLELEPCECMVVEDSLSGVQSACAAGIGTIIAMSPEKDRDEIRSNPRVLTVIEDYIDFAEKYL